MRDDVTPDRQEIETLTRSVENVLRRLIGFLVGKISLIRLQEMVRFIYVEKAEDQIRSESPTKSVPLTKLALLTGLDTRTLSRTKNHGSYRKPFHKKKSFLREFTPAAAILDVWATNRDFFDHSSGKPKKLKIEGAENSFEILFKTAIKSRGVTLQSLLERLIESGAVQIDESGENVELIKQSYLPIHSADQLGAFEMGYSAVANLMETIVHNFETTDRDKKFFQRGVWTHRLSVDQRKNLLTALTPILDTAENDSRLVLERFEDDFENQYQITAGVSFFYFEDSDLPK